MAEKFDADFERQVRARLAERGRKVPLSTQLTPRPAPFVKPNLSAPPVQAPPVQTPSKPAAVRSLAPTNRVGGRLVRESLVKVSPAPKSQLPGPSTRDFQRKVEELEQSEAAPLQTLPADRSTLDVERGFDTTSSTDPVSSFILSPRDLVRSFIFAELFGKPKGRR